MLCKRVLWISNLELTSDLRSSGGWIYGMAHALLLENKIQLGNIIPVKTKIVRYSKYKSIHQWKIPKLKSKLNVRHRKFVLDIIAEFKPDLIHIWGIENGYALITPFVSCPVLIEIQGIVSEISNYLNIGLTFWDKLKNIGLKEILTLDLIFIQKYRMRNMIKREKQIFEINKYFTTPTDWMQANIEAVNDRIQCYSNGFVLRDDFYNTDKWISSSEHIVVLTVTSLLVPFKGIHILLDAIAILKKNIPEIELRIIGPISIKGIRTSAYIRFLLNKIKKLNLKENVKWLGSLNAHQICEQMHSASVFVTPSFIESAGMTILEAMSVGIPIVASFTGGIPSFNAGSVLYFPYGDYKMCAHQIKKAIFDNEIQLTSADISRTYIYKHHNKEKVVANQLLIYNEILNKEIN